MIIDATCSDLPFRKTVIRAHQSSSRVFIHVYYAMASFFTCLVICSGALPMASALIADPDIRMALLNKPNNKMRVSQISNLIIEYKQHLNCIKKFILQNKNIEAC